MNSRAKILIVDDTAANRLSIRKVLRDVEADLDEADNGFDALSLTLNNHYALILLDGFMPDMDGFEVCEQLRANPQTAKTPVIFITEAYKNVEDNIRGYVAGATDYLTKPVNEHILKAKVQIFLRLFEQQSELQQALSAKSQFISSMSHEIRTPLNAILGFSAILSDLVEEPLQRHYLKAISTSSNILLQLINDILDLSKIEANKLTLQYTPIAIKAVLNEMALLFSQNLADKGVNFSVEIDKSVPSYVILDEIRIRQILLNLIGNAAKFTDKGFVKITVSSTPAAAEHLVNLTIAVADSGIGIAKDQQDTIFSAFSQQIHQNPRYGGTGLGLSICKRLLDLMDGTIKLDSAPNLGSCFQFTLNNVEVAKPTRVYQEPETTPQPVKQFLPATVLLLNDTPINRQLIRSYLREFQQLTIVEADNCEQALARLKERPFDLLLLDKRLPQADANRLCQAVKALPQQADLPIVVINTSMLPSVENPPDFCDLQIDAPLNKAKLLNALYLFLASEIPPAEPQTAAVAEPECVSSVSADQRRALLALLVQDYQPKIKELQELGIFDVSAFLEMAEQLSVVAQQYQCYALQAWADTLKKQTELFDLKNISQALANFDVLLTDLHTSL
jgi:signal transduction histidine kinase